MLEGEVAVHMGVGAQNVAASAARGRLAAGWGAAGEGLAGRVAELAAIAQCRAEVTEGTPWVVVVEGEAGIGKTALARRAVEPGVDGLRVCWAQADRSERDYPYGAVEQWLRRIPLDTAGVSELLAALGPAASPLTVGADLLAVVAAACETAPLALVLDDAPWADEPSLKALAFILRRLYAEPVLVVITARTDDADARKPPGDSTTPGESPGPDWHSFTRGAAHLLPLHLTGLSLDETGEMVAALAAGRLGRAALERLHERTAGHPLHLRSLLTQVTPEALADLARPLPVPATLDAITRHTLDHLPDDTRRLIEALAVLDTATPLATAAQLADLAEPAHALTPALDSGLIHWQPDQPTTPLRIHHQLQRDAIYQAIAPARRRDLHATAATLVGPDAAWAHRVAATDHTDPQLTADLSADAQRQASEGRYDRAATLELWASALAPTRDQYEHHLITATTHLCIGQVHLRAHALGDALRQCAPSPRRDAILGLLTAIAGGDPATAVPLLTGAVADAPDPVTRLIAGSGLGAVHLYRADGSNAVTALQTVIGQLPSGATYGLRGMLGLALGYAEGPAAGLREFAEFMPEPATHVLHTASNLLRGRGFLRLCAGELAAGTDDLTVLLASQRADSNVPVVPSDHFRLGFAYYLTGRWTDAAMSAERALLASDIHGHLEGVAAAHAVAALVHAQQGRQQQAQADLDACDQQLDRFPELSSLYPPLVRAVLAQARADHPAMLNAIRAVDDPATVAPGLRNLNLILWVPLLVEAATAATAPATADQQHAEDALLKFDALAKNAPALAATSHWLHARLAVTNSDLDRALAHDRAGLATSARDGDDIPLHRAFLHHDLAHHLLAGHPHDRAEAISHLQQAHHAYTALGAVPYAQRAADQLTRLQPAAAPLSAHDPLAALTEREQEIAHLAAQGLTNQEIARDLYLSPKTVEYHLGNIYTKLHLTSRRQLRTTSA